MTTSNHWMEGPLKGLFTHRQLADTVPTESIELIPFDITLALTGSQAVNTVALTDAVTDWMNENFEESVANVGYRYNFERVVLRTLEISTSGNNNNRRDLQSALKVTYDGMSYWKKDRELPSETTVAAMQLSALVSRDALLAKLRTESDDRGLGAAVVDARGDLNRNAQLPASGSSNGDQSLDVIIIVAIVIAVLASLLLIFALFMAWRTGKERKERTYHDGTRQTSNPNHGTSQINEQPRDRNIENNTVGPYSDSVITDDISSSLSAYYKSGMAGGYKANRSQHGALNDAASVSSMESYGYSLDGYASSIAN